MSAYEPDHTTQAPDPCHQAADWQERIAGYLTHEWGLDAPYVFVVLARCEADKATRATYLLLTADACHLTPQQITREVLL